MLSSFLSRPVADDGPAGGREGGEAEAAPSEPSVVVVAAVGSAEARSACESDVELRKRFSDALLARKEALTDEELAGLYSCGPM